MQIRMDKENRELKAHGSYEFPVNISYEQLSRYERGSFSWHWHPEIELTFVLSGQIGYQVNGKSYVLKEGDGIFCNTNALHSGHMIDGMDCVYISTTFAPRFLYGFSNSVIQTRYVEPVLTDMQLASIVFSPEIDWQNQVLACMHRIYDLSLSQPSAFEMEIQELLLSIWIEIYRHASFSGESQNTAAARDVERLRILLDYIHRHYMEHLTLEDLAAAVPRARHGRRMAPLLPCRQDELPRRGRRLHEVRLRPARQLRPDRQVRQHRQPRRGLHLQEVRGPRRRFRHAGSAA